MQFQEKSNGQTFRKKAKCSFEKSSFKKRMDKLFKKKQMQFEKKRIFEWTNIEISKNRKMQFGEKQNGQTFTKTDKCSFRKKQTDKHFKKKQMQF